jgi:hypothetical protein
MCRLADVKQCANGIKGPGVPVTLFPIVDSNRTLWIVGSPRANKWTPRNAKDGHKANAKAFDQVKASHAPKAGSAPTKLKVVRQKELRSRTKGERNVVGQPVQDGHSVSNDTSDEQESEQEDEQEGNAGDDVAEEDIEEDVNHSGAEEEAEEEGDAVENAEEDLNDSEEEEDLEREEEEEAAVDETGHDTEERDGDEHGRASGEAEAEEADQRGNEEHEGEEDPAEDMGEKEELEGQQEAERKGEREGEEKTGDETEPHGETRGKDCEVHDGEEEEHGGDVEAREEQGDQDQVQGVENAMGQHATTNNRDGSWRSWKVGATNGKENEGMCTNADEEERMVEDENGSAEETRKRPVVCSTLENRPNKRSKTDNGEIEDDAATKDSPSRTDDLKAQPRPRTPSLQPTTPSSPKTIEIIRHISVVPGLEGTESAVWDAARRDAVFTSLSGADQKKMVCTAVSLGSEKGIEELRRFVYDARRNAKQKGKSLESEFDHSASQSDLDTRNADGTLNTRDSGLARFSALYQQIVNLDKVAIKLSVTRRVKLAALAQYRKGLVQNGAGRNQAKDANLYLFCAIHP